MGLALLISGMILMLLSSSYHFLFYVGLGSVISAYIVPSLYARYTEKGRKCTDSCSVPKNSED